MEALEQVQEFARKAHGEQQRKYEDKPYIVHLIRVMETCRQYSKDPMVLAAALLHDTLEDTKVSAEQLKDYLTGLFGEPAATRCLNLVIELTDVYTKDNYPSWNRRKRKQQEGIRLSKTSRDAQTIKYADILDNSMSIMNANDDFVNVYLHEARSLLQAMKNGDEKLRSVAIEAVDNCLMKIRS